MCSSFVVSDKGLKNIILPTVISVTNLGHVVWLGTYNLDKTKHKGELNISLENICYIK